MKCERPPKDLPYGAAMPGEPPVPPGLHRFRYMRYVADTGMETYWYEDEPPLPELDPFLLAVSRYLPWSRLGPDRYELAKRLDDAGLLNRDAVLP